MPGNSKSEDLKSRNYIYEQKVEGIKVCRALHDYARRKISSELFSNICMPLPLRLIQQEMHAYISPKSLLRLPDVNHEC